MGGNLISQYLEYIAEVRRYSPRTLAIYEAAIASFMGYTLGEEDPGIVSEASYGDSDIVGETGLCESFDDSQLASALTPTAVRNYEVHLLDEKGLSPRTVNLHLSVISGLSRYLLKARKIDMNPIKVISRPKTPKRLPVFFRKELMEKYFSQTAYLALSENMELYEGGGEGARKMYDGLCKRLIIKTLYDTGIRRAELIGLNVGSVDFSRRTLRVRGKGDKMREIPLVVSLCKEISLYLNVTVLMRGCEMGQDEPLFRSVNGGRLYPMAVERMVSTELQGCGALGQTSPHVLRHTLATELLDEGADMNSIKELLGHSSLAATQVYTHNSIEKLKNVYINAHPRAKNGG